MQDLPHNYSVCANADAASLVTVSGEGLMDLETAAPAEFGGPGNVWSPETLLVAAVANCFILTFRAIARASKLQWTSLSCDVRGTLDKVDKVTRFTGFDLSAELTVPAGVDESKAHRLLENAERHCLVTNSLKAETTLSAKISVAV